MNVSLQWLSAKIMLTLHIKILIFQQYSLRQISLAFHVNRPFISWGIYFKIEPWKCKVNVIRMVKGQDHIVSPVSNWFASLSFTSIRPVISGFFLIQTFTNHDYDTTNTHLQFEEKVIRQNEFLTHFLQNYILSCKRRYASTIWPSLVSPVPKPLSELMLIYC